MVVVKDAWTRIKQRQLAGYELAVIGTVIAALVRWILGRYFDDLPPYITFYPVVVLGAALGGTAAGVLATVLSSILVTFLFLAHERDVYFISAGEAVGLALFSCINLAISLLGGRLRSARWKAEAEASRAEAAARELQRLVRLLDLANVLVVGMDDRIIRWNTGCQRLYGFTAEQAVGRISHELLLTRAAEPIQDIRANLVKTGRWEGELTHTALDGREITVASEWVLWRDPDGQPGAVMETDTDITERRKAELALRESEQRLRGTFHNAALGIIEINVEDRCIAVNDRMCQILEYTREELLGMSLSELTAEEDRPRSRQLIARLKEGRIDRFDYEKRYLRRNGSPLWVHVTASAVRDADGRFLRAVGTVEDISERVKAEQRVRQLNQHLEERNAELDAERARWRGVVEGIADEVWVCDVDGKMNLINTFPACSNRESCPICHVNGKMNMAEVSAVTAMDLPACKDKTMEQLLEDVEILQADGMPRPLDQTPLLRSLRGEVARGEEIMRHRRTGKVCHRQFSSAPIRDALGNITGAVAIVRDITDYKNADRALRDSELRFRAMAETIPDVIFTCRPDGWCDYVNPRYYEVTGLLPVEAEGWGWVPSLHSDDVECTRKAWQHSVATGEPFEVEFRFPTAEGSYRWFVARAQPVRDEQNRIVKWFGVCVDVHEMKSAQEALAAAKLAAEEASRAKDYFFAVLSHELRTPLMPISWSVQLLEADQSLKLSQEQREHLARIHRNVDREARLIDDLLDVNRIIHGKLRLSLRPAALQGIIQRSVDVCRSEIEARRLHVSVDVPAEPCIVEADEHRMEQVFSNLIRNAVKFTSPEGCLSIHCLQENGEIVTEVADNGVGIEPEALSRIFGAFEQAKSGRRASTGLGLGLAIAKSLVEQHCGSISAASPGAGRGATFTVRLPGKAPQALPTAVSLTEGGQSG